MTAIETEKGTWKATKVTLYVKVLVKAGDDEDAVLDNVRERVEDAVFEVYPHQDGRYVTDVAWQ